MGVDQAVAFPNFGLLWERTLDEDLGALTADITAWNRWCVGGRPTAEVASIPSLT